MKRDEIVTFSLNIERIVKENKLSYIDAVLHYCEVNGIEADLIPKFLTGSLKAKIKLEAEDLNFLPKSTTRKLT